MVTTHTEDHYLLLQRKIPYINVEYADALLRAFAFPRNLTFTKENEPAPPHTSDLSCLTIAMFEDLGLTTIF